MTRSLATALAAALLVLVLAVPAVAQEEEGSVTLGYGGGWYFLGGATGGASLTGDTGGGYVGAEASVARLRRGWWYGLYSDAFYDFGQQNMTITAGPEFGFSVFGIDGGIGVRPGPDQPLEVGPQIRGLVTVGLFAIYARYGFWPDSTTHRHVRQLGLMLKLPLAAPWAFGPSAGWDMGNRSRSR